MKKKFIFVLTLLLALTSFVGVHADDTEPTVPAEEITVPFSIEKVWEDENGNVIDWPENVDKVNLLVSYGNDLTRAEIEVELTPTSNTANGSFTLSNLDGDLYFEVDEDYIEGFYKSGMTVDDENKITIFNTKSEDENIPTTFIDLVSLMVYWNDDNNSKNIRPEELQFNVTDKDGNPVESEQIGHIEKANEMNYEEILAQIIEEYEANKDQMSGEEKAQAEEFIANWSQHVEDLKAQYGTADTWVAMYFVSYEGDVGKEYKVSAPTISGYDLTQEAVEGERGNQAFVFVYELEKQTTFIDVISVMKYWDDNDNAKGQRPSELQLIVKDQDGNLIKENEMGLIREIDTLDYEAFAAAMKEEFAAREAEGVTDEQKAEMQKMIADMEAEIARIKEQYGSTKPWLRIWVLSYEAKEGRTYTVEEPSVANYQLVKAETSGDKGAQTFIFSNKFVVSYSIKAGNNSTFKRDNNDLVITLDGNGDFVIDEVKIDGTKIEKFTFKDNKLTIDSAFLKTLKNGEHSFDVVFKDGSISGKFNIKTPTQPTTQKHVVPKTGVE